MHRAVPFVCLALPLAVAVALPVAGCRQPVATFAAAPPRLADTGLYADFAARTLAPGVLSYTPQYPLWSDGARKQRWIALPPGTAIDATDPDHWDFPIGTRLWKQFDFGRAVETRFMHRRTDGAWLYATYQWNVEGTDAVLAPDAGVRNVCPTRDGQHHDLPSVGECRACHEGTATPVLGFSALQLAADRDPLAPHAEPKQAFDVDLPALVARHLVRNLPERWQTESPRIAAHTPRERAVLGYLHANCGNCHNDTGPLHRLGLRLHYPLATQAHPPAIATTLGVASQFTRQDATMRVVAGAPEQSVLVRRLAARDALTRMPPLGRHLADEQASTLVAEWIEHDLTLGQ
jgi:hypothetical protein